MSRKKEAFAPIDKGVVKMYTCGPTVYDFAHIGNMRAYLFYDLVRRHMEYKGFVVKHVMNLTDVDDKTIKGAKSSSMPLAEFTSKYAEAFFADLEILKIKRAHVYPKATEHINDMVDMIRKLLLKNNAYRGEDGSIYYKISSFRKYGKLSHLKLKELKLGARVSQDEYTKEHVQDFALWKAWQEEDGNVFWATPLGKGRPGWHIECSAMSIKYLKNIDIHGGGVDLVFPHHENEIAQAEAATGKNFVKYWLHCEHLLVDGRKMSKSLGNFYTLRDLLSKGCDPIAFRYLCMSSHYRSQINFTFRSLEKAKKTVDNFNDFVQRILWLKDEVNAKPNHRLHVLIKKTKERFEKQMDDDLNTPQALAVVFDLIKDINTEIDKNMADKKALQAAYKFLMQVNEIFDIMEKPTDEITDEEKRLIEKREQLRKEKKFDEADGIRIQLREKGILLEDTPYGIRWKKVKSGEK